MSIDAAAFKKGMRHLAASVTLITTRHGDLRGGLTATAVCSVSAEPPLVLVCINRKSPAMAAVEANGVFAVNLLSSAHRAYAETFSGRPREGSPFDFSNHDWRDGETGLPLVTDATAIFECEMHDRLDAGTHRIFIGRVVAAHSGAADPLVYCNRAFRRIVTHEGL